MRTLQNSIVVLIATLATAVAVYGGVSALGTPSIALTASTDASASDQVCPSTGCAALSCHATGGGSGTAPPTDDDATVQTCPATGCTSVGCHATDGGSGGFGGHGRGRHGRTAPGPNGIPGSATDDDSQDWPTT